MNLLGFLRRTVDYGTTAVPRWYRCSYCGARGVKLWRDYQTYADKTPLWCADCAESLARITKGASWKSPFALGTGDQISWRVPAVPTQQSTAKRREYWGYTSVPQAGVDWWKRLPTR